MQCIVYHHNKPYLVDSDGEPYLELEEDELFEKLPVIPKDVQYPSVAEHFKS